MRRFFVPLIALLMAVGHSAAQAAIILPDPSMVIDGTPVATDPASVDPNNPEDFGDDFYSYSTDILEQLQNLYPAVLPVATYGDFGAERSGAGVGNQDLIIYTQAGGQTNGPTIDSPLPAVTGAGNTTFTGTWGDGSDPASNGQTTTVGEVLSFLPAGATIPVFAFDHNNTGVHPDISFGGYVEILDDVTLNRVDLWSYDTIFQAGNGTYDPGSPVTAPGTITKPNNTFGTLTGNGNTGSGTIDFWGFAPTMNLANYDPNDIFRVYVDLSRLDNGGEELFISGTIAARVIPEPASIAAFSLMGLVGGIGAIRRRKR